MMFMYSTYIYMYMCIHIHICIYIIYTQVLPSAWTWPCDRGAFFDAYRL